MVFNHQFHQDSTTIRSTQAIHSFHPLDGQNKRYPRLKAEEMKSLTTEKNKKSLGLNPCPKDLRPNLSIKDYHTIPRDFIWTLILIFITIYIQWA